tara:strand:- start:486 stop:3860 length:3375 start_codon:yes stop_codon:yes gene_type:complete
MSGNYDDFDLEKEFEHLTPQELTLNRMGPWVVGSDFLDGLKATVGRLFTADPDAIFYVMKLAAGRLLATARSLEEDLLRLYILLPSATGVDTPMPSADIQALRAGFASVKDGGAAKRRRMLQKIKKDIKKLLADAITAPGVSPLGARNPSDVRKEISTLLARIDKKLEVITTLNINFQSAITNYFESGLQLTASEVQADTILTRIDGFLRSGGVDLARVVMTSSLGIGLLDERLTLRDPTAPKYVGGVSVLAGQNAAIKGGVSLPFRLPANALAPLVVDTSTQKGALMAQASTVPDVSVVPLPLVNYSQQDYQNFYALKHAGEHFISDMVLPPYSVETLPFPYPSGVIDSVGTDVLDINLKVLVNNTTYSVTATGRVYTLEQLANRLTAAFVDQSVPLMVEVSSGDLKFTFIGSNYYGAASRFAFFSSAGGPAENDLNLRMGLTYERLGEFFGADTLLPDVSYVPPPGEVDPALPLITSSVEYERRFSGVVVHANQFKLDSSAGTTNLEGFSHEDVKVGDCVIVQASDEETAVPLASYRVTDVSEVSGVVVLTVDREILRPFDGASLLDKPCTVRVVRDLLLITSPSKAWATTRLRGFVDNLGLDPGTTSAALPVVPPMPPVPVEDYTQATTFFTYKPIGCVNGVASIEVYAANPKPITGYEIALDVTKYDGDAEGQIGYGNYSTYHATVSAEGYKIARFIGLSLFGNAIPASATPQLIATLKLSPCETAPVDIVPLAEKVVGEEHGPVANYVTGDLNSDGFLDILDVVGHCNVLTTSNTLLGTTGPTANASGTAGIENLPGLVELILLAGDGGYIIPREVLYVGPGSETVSQPDQAALVFTPPVVNADTVGPGSRSYSEGLHTTLTLTDTAEMGSPLRVRDSFVTADSSGWGWALGRILSSNTNTVTLSLYNDAPIPDPPGSATKLTYGDPFDDMLLDKGLTAPSPYKANGARVTVYSLGAYTYRHVSRFLPDVNTAWAGVLSLEDLTKRVGVYASTGTSRELAEEAIYDYLLANKTTIEVYRSFDANMSDGVVKLFRALGENKLERFKELLLSLRFDLLFELDLAELSVVEEISKLINTLSDDYGSGSEVMNLREDPDGYDFTNQESNDSVDDEMIWPAQEE